jgi:hypothetical protein
MSDTTYNGWSNYATWRINLEIFDGLDLDLDAYMVEEGEEMDVYTFKDEVQQIAEDAIFEGLDERRPTSLVEDYARAFLQDVNWYEIADHLLKDYERDFKA